MSIKNPTRFPDDFSEVGTIIKDIEYNALLDMYQYMKNVPYCDNYQMRLLVVRDFLNKVLSNLENLDVK